MTDIDPKFETAKKEPLRVVLLGGGHSHVEVLRKWAMNPAPEARLSLITKDYHAPYSGMLPGLIAGHYDYDQCHIDVAPLAQAAGCRFLHDEVVSVDLEKKQVHCANRPPVNFDLLSINVGSKPHMSTVLGAEKHALSARPVDRFLVHWEELQQKVAKAKEPFRFLIVGGGAGGVELSLAMQHRLNEATSSNGSLPPEFHLATETLEILPTHNARVRRILTETLEQRGIRTYFGHRASNVTDAQVVFENDKSLPYDALIWVTSASPAAWIKESGIAIDAEGFIATDRTLRSTSHSFVFGAGDCATFMESPHAKSGVYAVRQGPYLYENLRHAARGEALEPFKPQKRFLSLISTGDKNAVASKGAWAWKGPKIWQWKDRIDLTWMDKYNIAPGMSMPAPAPMDSGEMHCGGCGCKLGGSTLSTVLERLRRDATGGQAKALEHADDAAVLDVPTGKLAIRTVDFFRSFIDDPFVFGQVAAHHCLSDVYAMGAKPHDALATVTLPYVGANEGEDLLYDLLAGALKVLGEAGALLVGGHTTEGPEMAFGLTVTGYADEADLMRKGGMNPGDKLILTKPLGTGALFAAHMRGAARGRWIGSAIESMLISNRHAAQVFRAHAATSCTDVTGFGIAGHLLEMLRDSNASATLHINDISLLPGALEVTEEGIASTLYPQNVHYAAAIREWSRHETDPRARLLFDPQTAGGLLASVPKERADECLAALREAGCHSATVVGTCDPLEAGVSAITLVGNS